LNSSEENSLEKRLNNETDGHFVEGLLRYIEYLGHDNIRLPPGICLPNVCSAKDAEWAINKILYPLTHMSIIINPDCDYKGKPVDTFNNRKANT
ncbi:unnamed protein product, partial [Oppiella nova]